jgi:uncharacterized repeat protein (TIGR01451 family)
MDVDIAMRSTNRHRFVTIPTTELRPPQRVFQHICNMKHLSALLFCIGTIFFASAQAPVTIDWEVASTAGGGTNQPQAIKRTLDGGYVVAGSTSTNIRVAKFAADGTELWSGVYGGPGSPDNAVEVLVLPNGHFLVAGYVFGEGGDITGSNGGIDAWLIELDGSGELLWQRCYGGSGWDRVYSAALTSDGGIIMTGSSTSSDGDVGMNQGGTDLWLVKLDAAHDIDWEYTYGGTQDDQGTSVQQTADGGYIVAGSTASNNGDVTGHHGINDLWVLKVSATGALEWQHALGGTANDYGGGKVLQVDDGGYVVATSSMSTDGDLTSNNGIFDFWVLKLDAQGEIVWQHSYGGPETEYCNGIAATLDGGFILTGSTHAAGGHVSHYHGGMMDAWVVKLNGDGLMEWQRSFGGSLLDEGHAIIQDPDGSYVMASRSSSTDGDASSGTPAGDFWIVKFTGATNFVTGKVFADMNVNGTYDEGDVLLHNHMILDALGDNLAFTDSNGVYEHASHAGAQVILSPAEIANYTAAPASHAYTFNGVNEVVTDRDFALQPTGVFTDLMVSLIPITAFRPGYPAMMELRCKNIGTTTLNGASVIYWNVSPLLFDYFGTTPVPESSDPVWWPIPELPPFGEFTVTIHVDVPASAVPGTVLSPSALSMTPDDDPANNQSHASITITGSYDPNDIQVDKPVLLVQDLAGAPVLDYLIRFQNTGTDTAFTVQIRNPIPAGVDMSTFEFVSSSHQVQLQYVQAEDLLWFRFDDILLPDSNTNEALSHGYVRYRIAPFTDLSVGDVIANQVGIYFDFNEPVITNIATTEIISTTAVAEQVQAGQLLLHPNPTSGDLLIQMDLHHAARVHVEMFNGTGQIMRTMPLRDVSAGLSHFALSCEGLPDGVYYVRIHMGGEVVTRKVVKL